MSHNALSLHLNAMMHAHGFQSRWQGRTGTFTHTATALSAQLIHSEDQTTVFGHVDGQGVRCSAGPRGPDLRALNRRILQRLHAHSDQLDCPHRIGQGLGLGAGGQQRGSSGSADPKKPRSGRCRSV